MFGLFYLGREKTNHSPSSIYSAKSCLKESRNKNFYIKKRVIRVNTYIR